MANFQETRWSLIHRALQGERDALGEIYASYWAPLLAYAQYELSLDADSAEEAVQEFTSRAFVDRRVLEQADPRKGRFRRYLKVSFRNFVYEQWRRDRTAAGRHGPLVHLEASESLEPPCQEESPSLVFEKTWVVELLAQALARWRQECHKRDPRRWRVYELRVLTPLLNGTLPTPYEELCRDLGFDTPKGVMNLVVNANRAIQRHLRALLEQDLTRGADMDLLVRQRAEELLQSGAAADAETAHREASSQLREELQEAVDAEILDIRSVLCAPSSAPARVQMRKAVEDLPVPESRENGSRRQENAAGQAVDLPTISHGPSGAMPADGQAVYQSSMHVFLSAHLAHDADAAESPKQLQRRDARPRTPPPDPAEYDFRRFVAAFLDVELATEGDGASERLRASLAEQISRPLPWPTSRKAGETACVTLGDLLDHPQPSLDQLVQFKEFARDCRENRTSLPAEVATVLYFTAIALALVRWGRRITTLPDEQVVNGLRWSRAAAWVDPRIRLAMQQAEALIVEPR